MNKSSLSFRAAVLAFGNGTAALVQMVVAAVLARLLTQHDFGTYRETYLFYNMIVPALGLGLPSALLYFLPRNDNRGRNLLSENLMILSIMGALFSLFLLCGGAEFVAERFHNPDLVLPLRWFAIIPIFSLPLAAVPPCLIAVRRPEWVAAFSITTGVLRMILVVAPVVLIAQTPVMAIQGGAATSVLMLIPGMLLMFYAVSKGSFVPSRQGIWNQVSYAVPLGLGAMIGTIHKGTDKIIVAMMVDPGTVAVFANGAMEIPFISLLTGSAAAVMIPEISRLYDEGKYDQALAIFRSSAIKCGTILAPIAGWFFLSAPWVMTYLYGDNYIGSAAIFQIYLLLLPLRVAFFGPLFQAAGRSDLVLTRSIVGFVGNIVLTLVGAYYFGPIGAAWGTVLSILLFVYLFCLVASARLYRTSIAKLLPFRHLTKLFLPIVVIVTALMYFSRWLQWEQDLSLTAWFVLSALYVVAVLAAYRSLAIISLTDLARRVRGFID